MLASIMRYNNDYYGGHVVRDHALLPGLDWGQNHLFEVILSRVHAEPGISWIGETSNMDLIEFGHMGILMSLDSTGFRFLVDIRMQFFRYTSFNGRPWIFSIGTCSLVLFFFLLS